MIPQWGLRDLACVWRGVEWRGVSGAVRCDAVWMEESSARRGVEILFAHGVLGEGCWVQGAGCWVMGVGCWVLVMDDDRHVAQ